MIWIPAFAGMTSVAFEISRTLGDAILEKPSHVLDDQEGPLWKLIQATWKTYQAAFLGRAKLGQHLGALQKTPSTRCRSKVLSDCDPYRNFFYAEPRVPKAKGPGRVSHAVGFEPPQRVDQPIPTRSNGSSISTFAQGVKTSAGWPRAVSSRRAANRGCFRSVW